eukprot:Lankesteria_metandrocarpae@DN914_c0_g1_i1.p1
MAQVTFGVPLAEAASVGVRDILSMVHGSEQQYFDEQRFSESAIKRQLSDSNTDLKIDAMKRLLAVASCGREVSRFYPYVVKNITSPNLDLKRLVYMYLVAQSDSNRDTVLLAINSFQKDLVDRHQVVRAAALRGMTSIRAVEIIQIVMTNIRKAAGDTSPYVRKTAAQCIPKAMAIDSDQWPEGREILLKLMSDMETCVVGAAISSFSQVCFNSQWESRGTGVQQMHRNNFAHLHPRYSQLCTALPKLESWAQVKTIDVLVRYMRFFFPDAKLILANRIEESSDVRVAAWAAEMQDSLGAAPTASEFYADYIQLLHALVALLRSDRASVVIATAVGIFNILPTDVLKETSPRQTHSDVPNVAISSPRRSPKTTKTKQDEQLYNFVRSYAEKTISAILRCLSNAEPGMHEMLFKMCIPLICSARCVSREHIQCFFIQHMDSSSIKLQKIYILQQLCDSSNAKVVLGELQSYLSLPGDPAFIAGIFSTIALLALGLPSVIDGCLRGLISILDSSSPLLASEAVVALCTLLQQRTQAGASVPEPLQVASRTNTGQLKSLIPADNRSTGSTASTGTAQSTALFRHNIIAPVILHLVKLLIIPSNYSACLPTGNSTNNDTAALDFGDHLAHSGGNTPVYRLQSPVARASVTWIIARYHQNKDVPTCWPPEALRVLTCGFQKEEPSVKLQILAFAVKLWGYHKEHEVVDKPSPALTADEGTNEYFTRIDGFLEYLLTSGQADSDYDVRDLSRTLSVIKQHANRRTLANDDLHSNESALVAFAKEYVRTAARPRDGDVERGHTLLKAQYLHSSLGCDLQSERWTPGSLSNTIEETVEGYVPLPEFATSCDNLPSRRRSDKIATNTASASNGTVSFSATGTGSQFVFAPMEAVVPSRSTYIPKMEFDDDLENFYSDSLLPWKQEGSTAMPALQGAAVGGRSPQRTISGTAGGIAVAGEDEESDEEDFRDLTRITTK